MIDVVTYSQDKRSAWNDFVSHSKNGTFMLGRDYLEYHADRFEDCSLMLYDNKTLKAVLPASRHGAEVRSHGGLTYGGLIYDLKMTVQLALQCFEAIKKFLATAGFEKLIYKRVPSIYYTYPSDEDLYALFVNQARLIRRDISSCILLPNRIRFNERRRRNIKKAVNAGLDIRKTDDYTAYIDLLSNVLQERHQAEPVHTSREIESLAQLHPENIKLFAAYKGQEMLAGTLVYETPLVAHTQYLASNAEGRSYGALDLVIDYLVTNIYQQKTYFDFGISTENNGLYLNEGLSGQKQEFGGRGVAYDFYELAMK